MGDPGNQVITDGDESEIRIKLCGLRHAGIVLMKAPPSAKPKSLLFCN